MLHMVAPAHDVMFYEVLRTLHLYQMVITSYLRALAKLYTFVLTIFRAKES